MKKLLFSIILFCGLSTGVNATKVSTDITFKGKLTESEIPTSGWKRGVYIVRVTSGDDVYSRKIII